MTLSHVPPAKPGRGGFKNRLKIKFQLFDPLIFLLLLRDICANNFLIQTNGNKIPTCPETPASKASYFVLNFSDYVDALYPFMKSTTCATEYFGRMDMYIWTWSLHKCPSKFRTLAAWLTYGKPLPGMQKFFRTKLCGDVSVSKLYNIGSTYSPLSLFCAQSEQLTGVRFCSIPAKIKLLWPPRQSQGIHQ